MKKLLKTVACLSLGLFTLTTVSAKEVDLAEGTVLEKNNVYIVGNWVFQLNNYGINGKDIAHAASRYTKITGKDAPVYYILDGLVYEYSERGAEADTKELGKLDEVFDEDTINALGLNDNEYQDLVLEEVEPAINDAIDVLNSSATSNGFKEISYEDQTATFYIADPSRDLASYQDNILSLIKSFTDEKYGVQTVSYGNHDYPISELNTEESIKALALKVLTDMASDRSLKYASVANKSANATVTYKDENNNTYSVTYTLKFVYDFETENNKVLADDAKTLNDKIKADTEGKYGFSEVRYENETITFEISDPTAQLANFAETGIAQMFLASYTGATKVVYSMAGQSPVTITLDDELDEAKVKGYAGQVLRYMAGAGSDLTVGSVANKTVTATVTYCDGKEVTYTLTFNFAVEEVKDEALYNYASELTDEISAMGFAGVEYDPQSNTIIFNIDDLDGTFSGNGNLIIKIAGMFQEWSKGATKVVYTVNGEACDDCEENFAAGTGNVVNLALKLLTKMANLTPDKVAEPEFEFTIGLLVGSYAEADFYFVGQNDPVHYIVRFDYNAEEKLFAALEEDVTELTSADTALNEGSYFDEITFENGSATFTVKNAKQTATFAEYGAKAKVLEMYAKVLPNATEITFTVNGVPKTYSATEGHIVDGTTLAKDLLTEMAKANNVEVTDPANIKLSDVAGVKASASITYTIGQSIQTSFLELEFVIAEAE